MRISELIDTLSMTEKSSVSLSGREAPTPRTFDFEGNLVWNLVIGKAYFLFISPLLDFGDFAFCSLR